MTPGTTCSASGRRARGQPRWWGYVRPTTCSAGRWAWTGSWRTPENPGGIVLWKGLSYGYTPAGDRAWFVDGEGARTDYAYDPNHRLTSIIRDGVEEVSFLYDLGSRREGIARANGVATWYTLDERGQLENLRHVGPDGQVAASFTYEYDSLGNRTAVTLDHWGMRVVYLHDGMNRLVSEQNLGTGSALPYANQFTAQPAGNASAFSETACATPAPFPEIPGFSEGLSYDGVGNRLSKDSTLSGFRSYSYDDDNRIIDERDGGGGVVVSYTSDGNGSIASRTTPAGTEDFLYDHENHLIGYGNAAGDLWTYTYTPGGERIAKTQPDGQCGGPHLNR